MATKSEVLSFIQQRYGVSSKDGSMVQISFDLEVGRSQIMFANVTDELLVLASPFAKVDDLTPNLAFKVGEDTIFGIKRYGTAYCLANVLTIDDIDESEIVIGMGFLAREADRLESSVGGDNF